MKLQLKDNEKLDLEIPKFDCDINPLGTHLNKYEMLSHLNSYSFNCIIGKPGSGKTSLLLSFLTGKGENKVFRKVFNHVLIVMPLTSRQSLKANPFKNHDPKKLYDDLTLQGINDIYDQLLESSEHDENTLLILDDVGASLKNNEIQKTLKRIIFNRRHLKVNIVCLLQSFISIPREIRKLISNCFLFKPSKVEFENFCLELFEKKKDEAIEIMNFVFDKPHVYLMLNVESQKMYKGFDQIIITE